MALALGTLQAHAGPRDAEAVLNRCGAPLKGDKIVLEDTVSGGRRILSYERGTIVFEKEGVNGWTFLDASARHREHLNQDQLGEIMPCFKAALADSLASEPLPHENKVKRVEFSIKENLEKVILWTVGSLFVLGLIFFIFTRGREEQEEIYPE